MKQFRFLSRFRTSVVLLLVISFALGGVLTGAQSVQAERVKDDGAFPAESTSIPVSASEREVAAYGQDYAGTSGYLGNAIGNTWGFYRTLVNSNWCDTNPNDCYYFSNANVWEDDWVDNNDQYIDTVDLVFYEGHGWPGGFTVRPPDDSYVEYWEIPGAGYWGNNDLEYIFLLSCSVLADEHKVDWYTRTFDHLHLLGGFATTAYDTGGFGTAFAQRILWGFSYKDAWFMTCDSHQPSGVEARILAETNANYYESAYWTNADPNYDGYYWWWDKWCGSPTQSTLKPEQLNATFPIFSTPPLNLSAESEQVRGLTSDFGFGTVSAASMAVTDLPETLVYTDTNGRSLEIDKDTGMYYYLEQNRAFTVTTATPSIYAANIMSPNDAKDIADAFLKDKGLLPVDSQYNIVNDVTVTQGDTPPRVGAADVQATAAVTPLLTTYEVVYSRYLTTTVSRVDAASGLVKSEVLTIAVDGEGAKMKVYVSPQAGVIQAADAMGGLADFPEVVGAQGGWRAVSDVTAAQPRADVPVLEYAQIEALFQQLEPEVAFASVPFDNPNKKEVVKDAQNQPIYNLAAYEGSNSGGQGELFPAYRLYARYEGQKLVNGIAETVVFTDYTWLPANEGYMRPLAKLQSTPDLNLVYMPGTEITASAVPATSTLASVGYDSILNFTMGSGGFYQYDWYLNDPSNQENRIGGGRDLIYKLPVSSEGAKNNLIPYTIYLKVTDLGQANSALSTSMTSFTITAAAPTYLPLLQR